MLVNLPNGKTVDMSFEDYVRIGMDDYGYLMSHNIGYEMEDPFFGSILRKGAIADKPEKEEEADTDADDGDGYFEEGVLYVEE